MHARRTTVASAARAVGILACLATSARRLQLAAAGVLLAGWNVGFSQAGRADVQRVVGDPLASGLCEWRLLAILIIGMCGLTAAAAFCARRSAFTDLFSLPELKPLDLPKAMVTTWIGP